MIDCERALELISLGLDEPLPQNDGQALDRHLAVCEPCRALAQDLSQLHAELGQLGECDAPAGFADGVLTKIAAERAIELPKVIPLWRSRRVKAFCGLAACAALCIGLLRYAPRVQAPPLAAPPVTPASSYSGGSAEGTLRSEPSTDAEKPPVPQLVTAAPPSTETPADTDTPAPKVQTPANVADSIPPDPVQTPLMSPAPPASPQYSAAGTPGETKQTTETSNGTLADPNEVQRPDVTAELTTLLGQTPGELLVLEVLPEELSQSGWQEADGLYWLTLTEGALADLVQALEGGTYTLLPGTQGGPCAVVLYK